VCVLLSCETDHREVFASLRLDRSICRPIVTCIKNNSERWITRLVRRWRAQPTAWISVNCRTPWTSTSWTHIAASGQPRGHAWPRVGLANYRCIFLFLSSVIGRQHLYFLLLYLFWGGKCDCISLKSLSVNKPSALTLYNTILRVREESADMLAVRAHTSVWTEQVCAGRVCVRRYGSKSCTVCLHIRLYSCLFCPPPLL